MFFVLFYCDIFQESGEKEDWFKTEGNYAFVWKIKLVKEIIIPALTGGAGYAPIGAGQRFAYAQQGLLDLVENLV